MYRITIDPGHGGKDRANRGPTGYVEADGVLEISLYLEAELLKYKDFQVELTRRTDMYLTLTERGRMAVDYKANLFISEHTNASNGTARGSTVFYSVDLPGDRIWAEKMAAAISQALGVPNRGAKTRALSSNPNEDYYTVIHTAQSGGVPHVLLVESAFHDNPEDEKLLKDDNMLKKIAQAQAGVINEWFNSGAGGGSGNPGGSGSPGGGASGGDTGGGTPSGSAALPVLKRGAAGDAVKILQYVLNSQGYNSGIIDGIFGANTSSAVMNYQKANGINANAIVDANVWKALLSCTVKA